jgi:hypothetical protein
MSPSELEEYLQREPLRSVRLTLSSGDQVVVNPGDEWLVTGLALVLRGEPETGRVTAGARLVSVPNVVLVEPLDSRPSHGGRRKRR